MHLSELCLIQTGYTVRSRLEPAAHGGVLTIQMRDIAPDGYVNPELLTRMQLDGVADRYFVCVGDVVFRSRGERNSAVALDGRFDESALALLPLFAFRPKLDLVTPEYLAWAINRPSAQRYFDSKARGTNMRMIPKSAIDDLELDVPDLETQRKIVTVDALASQERALSVRAADARRKLLGLVLDERVRKTSSAAGHKRKFR